MQYTEQCGSIVGGGLRCMAATLGTSLWEHDAHSSTKSSALLLGLRVKMHGSYARHGSLWEHPSVFAQTVSLTSHT